mgnify:CR=1 FL=1
MPRSGNTPSWWPISCASVSPIAVVPLIVVLGLSARTTGFLSLMAGAASAVVVAAFMQRELIAQVAGQTVSGAFGEWATASLVAMGEGFALDSGTDALDATFSGGGVLSMLPTVWLILVAAAFGALVTSTGMLDRLLEKVPDGEELNLISDQDPNHARAIARHRQGRRIRHRAYRNPPNRRVDGPRDAATVARDLAMFPVDLLHTLTRTWLSDHHRQTIAFAKRGEAVLERLAVLAHRHGATVVVDNTFLGPLWQHPLEHGADLVIYSATKYIGGHSDLIAGATLRGVTVARKMPEA